MTPETIAALYRQAARTMRINWPSDGPREPGSSWIDEVVQDVNNTYTTGATDLYGERYTITKTSPAKATPRETSQAEQCLWWAIEFLNEHERLALWYWAARKPVAWTAKKLHVNRSTAWRWKTEAVEKLARHVGDK